MRCCGDVGAGGAGGDVGDVSPVGCSRFTRNCRCWSGDAVDSLGKTMFTRKSLLKCSF
ncbi:hypothetical protein D3C80_1501600 [compost metagenome]